MRCVEGPDPEGPEGFIVQSIGGALAQGSSPYAQALDHDFIPGFSLAFCLEDGIPPGDKSLYFQGVARLEHALHLGIQVGMRQRKVRATAQQVADMAFHLGQHGAGCPFDPLVGGRRGGIERKDQQDGKRRVPLVDLQEQVDLVGGEGNGIGIDAKILEALANVCVCVSHQVGELRVQGRITQPLEDQVIEAASRRLQAIHQAVEELRIQVALGQVSVQGGEVLELRGAHGAAQVAEIGRLNLEHSVVPPAFFAAILP